MFYAHLLWIYIFLMIFGVINVVIGTFAATAADVAASDRESLTRQQMSNVSAVMNRIRTFFREADKDNSGTLSWEEFKHHLSRKEVQAFFGTTDLDVSQAHLLFQLLDSDASNSVTIDEFMTGCMRLKGKASNVDLNILLLASRRIAADVEELLRRGEAQSRCLNELATQASLAATWRTS